MMKTYVEHRQELLGVLSALENDITEFNSGQGNAYRWMAEKLQSLLLGSRTLPEIPDVRASIAQPKYHPLWRDAKFEKQMGALVPFFTGSVIGYDARIFDLDRPRIPLDAWLEQGIALYQGQLLTIRGLIRSSAGAQHDSEMRWVLEASESVLGSSESFRPAYVCALAAYIVVDTREQLGVFPGQTRVGPGNAGVTLMGVKWAESLAYAPSLSI